MPRDARGQPEEGDGVKRGDIFYCEDQLTAGSVVWSKGRPCVIVSSDQIVAIPKDRLGTRVASCTAEEMQAIEAGMLAGLGIAAAPEAPGDGDQLLVARTERDTYKRLYEQLLAKVLGVEA